MIAHKNCQLRCYCVHVTFLKHGVYSTSLWAVLLICVLLVFASVLKLEYFLWKPIQGAFWTSRSNNLSKDDFELYNSLIQRAKNRSNRYYFNDLTYFQMIQKEFPRTESASRIKCGSSFLTPLPTSLRSEDVLFIVMGSVAYIQKSKLLVETWLQWSHNNYFIFADASNITVPFTILPQLANKPTRNDAQHRQLVGSQWLIKNKSKLVERTKWFVFVDDDTWVNVPALLSYLQLFDHRLPLSIGYIWDHIWEKEWSYFSGGGGIVFSQPAFVSVIPAIYTTECPFKKWNDITLMYCQKRKGITKIHSDRFYWTKMETISSHPYLRALHYISKITFHYINDADTMKNMTCNVALYWKWPINGCNITYSEGLSN